MVKVQTIFPVIIINVAHVLSDEQKSSNFTQFIIEFSVAHYFDITRLSVESAAVRTESLNFHDLLLRFFDSNTNIDIKQKRLTIFKDHSSVHLPQFPTAKKERKGKLRKCFLAIFTRSLALL